MMNPATIHCLGENRCVAVLGRDFHVFRSAFECPLGADNQDADNKD